MDEKRVKLTILEQCDIITALRTMAGKYQEIGRYDTSLGNSTELPAWHRWATRCLSIVAKLEDCDSVELVTDGYSDADDNSQRDEYYAERNITPGDNRPF